MRFARRLIFNATDEPHLAASQDFASIVALSESNHCVALALPVSEQLTTQSTGRASGTH